MGCQKWSWKVVFNLLYSSEHRPSSRFLFLPIKRVTYKAVLILIWLHSTGLTMETKTISLYRFHHWLSQQRCYKESWKKEGDFLFLNQATLLTIRGKCFYWILRAHIHLSEMSYKNWHENKSPCLNLKYETKNSKWVLDGEQDCRSIWGGFGTHIVQAFPLVFNNNHITGFKLKPVRIAQNTY